VETGRQIHPQLRLRDSRLDPIGKSPRIHAGGAGFWEVRLTARRPFFPTTGNLAESVFQALEVRRHFHGASRPILARGHMVRYQSPCDSGWQRQESLSPLFSLAQSEGWSAPVHIVQRQVRHLVCPQRQLGETQGNGVVAPAGRLHSLDWPRSFRRPTD